MGGDKQTGMSEWRATQLPSHALCSHVWEANVKKRNSNTVPCVLYNKATLHKQGNAQYTLAFQFVSPAQTRRKATVAVNFTVYY